MVILIIGLSFFFKLSTTINVLIQHLKQTHSYDLRSDSGQKRNFS